MINPDLLYRGNVCSITVEVVALLTVEITCVCSYKITYYPCRCLCFLFLQVTLTTPFRLKILQSLHIFFTDERTFIISPP